MISFILLLLIGLPMGKPLIVICSCLSPGPLEFISDGYNCQFIVVNRTESSHQASIDAVSYRRRRLITSSRFQNTGAYCSSH